VCDFLVLTESGVSGSIRLLLIPFNKGIGPTSMQSGLALQASAAGYKVLFINVLSRKGQLLSCAHALRLDERVEMWINHTILAIR
jgi:hypothetical protein